MTLTRILNPITRQLIFDSYEGEGWVGGFIYRYDNHDQLSYRVVLIRGFNSKLKKVESDIFISETGEWRKSMVVFCPGKFHCRGVSYKNLLFWWDSKHGRLIGFDPYNNARRRFFEHPKKLECVVVA